ncbi:DUF3488 domain-containing transglutaminase family protein [Parahaliea sp. F7430]|uniref:DUF3488 domain-containing transglutaminase family protein n=1 Tax=Sediminihaliea albiluteola TaxID=2758564 RepID=A0A7W2TU77_9GAMM|nr:DUF3488 and transglutaminase-like domain-containing protein [Sediminihaliea albiluteola]MBA6412050.1 DUF3488 domain-containing transglutaminase family protein [Sediminihaliea albiluteola]
MSVLQQVPRNALVWLIISMFALLIPHLERIPFWVIALYILSATWRFMVHRGRWSFPARSMRLVLVVLSFAGIYFSYGSFLALESTVALLLTAYALKLLELVRRQDAYVLLFLGYFVCTTEFLFSQDLLIVLYSLLNVLLITTALVALHQPAQQVFHFGSLRYAGIMLLQAFPLMLVLFFLFPRIEPLWTVPIKSHAARTGVSDFMRPGDISRLSQSDEVAFRVQFDGEIPPPAELYWRGLVFSRLQDGAWSSIPSYAIPAQERAAPRLETKGEALRYTVLMRPTQQPWLYSLRYARSSDAAVIESADFRLYSSVDLEDQYRYQVNSWPQTVLDQDLSAWRRRSELQLPDDSNPRSRRLAQQMRSNSASDAEFVAEVLAMFRQQPFVYTLQPPLLGEQPMDDFLFNSRRGFCEHYAYAFTLMMRAAGIPARVVAGYQGGEVNPLNRTVIVHQFDAHAWAEVWLEGEGWRRVDPTAAVSPDRIELGLEQAMAAEGSFLSDSPLSPLRYRSISWLNSLRLRYDAMSYRWQSWVVGFDSERQFSLLESVMGRLTAQKFIAVFVGSGLLVLLPTAWLLLRKRRVSATDPIDQLYLSCCQALSAKGLERFSGEAPADFAQRAAQALPHAAEAIESMTKVYSGWVYGPRAEGAESEALRQMRLARTDLIRALSTRSRAAAAPSEAPQG